jgi:hypothetical protein
MALKVFISHSSKGAFASKVRDGVYAALQAKGFDVLLDRKHGRSPEIEVVDNIFSNLDTGISATRVFAPRVKSNLFSKTKQTFQGWDKSRPVKLEAGNIVADAQFVSGTYRLAANPPAKTAKKKMVKKKAAKKR